MNDDPVVELKRIGKALAGVPFCLLMSLVFLVLGPPLLIWECYKKDDWPWNVVNK